MNFCLLSECHRTAIIVASAHGDSCMQETGFGVQLGAEGNYLTINPLDVIVSGIRLRIVI